MRTAKTHGWNNWHLFATVLDTDSVREIRLAYEIREGIESGQFFFCYQPEVQLATMRTVALEALVRWEHPQRGLVPPAKFIPLCEEIGLMESLGARLLPEACAQVRAWREEFDTDVRLAVNVSAREFQAGGACARIVGALRDAGLSPQALEVEITESAVLADVARAIAVANELRAAGVSIALDDFGTGYSSLTHLHTLPIDKVKIDRSFVMSCLSDPSAAAIVEGIAILARRLGKTVVAEGVETAEQLEFVRGVGCDVVQGYYFEAPLDVGACAAHLGAGGSWSHVAV
jgi:EAL domain-containing protein (putative c-di-GMP-specific phosphodiesterase class I)